MDLLQAWNIALELFKLLTTLQWITLAQRVDTVFADVANSPLTKTFINNPQSTPLVSSCWSPWSPCW
ncbi:uncharacterized protein PG986_007970 [Apiospora aurea]|uniref:Uncharacterized protein n=1 Tax=Apiospora aurea TaxID=335848 RepID=A0ABR1QE35_9PEZI